MSYYEYAIVLIKKNKKLLRKDEDMFHNTIEFDNGIEIEFFKYSIIIKDILTEDKKYIVDLNSFRPECPYKRYRFKDIINGIEINSKRIGERDRYYTVIKYKDDLYEVIHGHDIEEEKNIDRLIYKDIDYINKLKNFMRNCE